MWRAGGCCGMWMRGGGAGASHVPVTEERGAARRAARGARQVSDVRESCGSVGLIALAWVQGSEFI